MQIFSLLMSVCMSATCFLFSHEAETLSCPPPPQCPSSGEILSHFGMSNLSRLTVGNLESICPAVLTQVLLPSCPHAVTEESHPVPSSGQLLHHFVCPAPRKSNTWQVMAVCCSRCCGRARM